MGFTAALLGGFVGFGAQVFGNAARKVPLSRRTFCDRDQYSTHRLTYNWLSLIHNLDYCHTEPWLHVGWFFAGAYIGNKLPQWERQLVEDINQLRAEKGLSPMVGTNAWIRYTTTDDQ